MTINVSVIIPTYNRWPLVSKAIDSVLQQTRQADEIIVVDDGSTDGTRQNLQHHYGDRIRLLHRENAGVSAARNFGVNTSTGDWIALLDSDDEWLPEKLQKQQQTIESTEDCVLCHTDEIWIRNGVRVNQMNKHSKSGGDIFSRCLPLCAISPSSTVIKKNILEELGGFDESLPACEDYDLWLRVCAQYKTHYLPEALLIKYGGHEDQLSRKHWGMDRFRIKSLQKLLSKTKLTDQQKQLTLDMLERKTVILLKGAIKHNNHELRDNCRSVLTQHGLTVPDTM